MVVVLIKRSGDTYSPGRRNSLGHCLWMFVVVVFGESVMDKWGRCSGDVCEECRRVFHHSIRHSGLT